MCSNTGHSGTTKAIQNQITGLCIMQNILHNSFVRYFSVICVCHVDWICFTFTHIRCKRFSVIIVCCLIIRNAILLDKILDERIRAGSIKRRIRKRNDILICTNWKAFNVAHFIYIFFGQLSAFHSCFLTFVF